MSDTTIAQRSVRRIERPEEAAPGSAIWATLREHQRLRAATDRALDVLHEAEERQRAYRECVESATLDSDMVAVAAATAGLAVAERVVPSLTARLDHVEHQADLARQSAVLDFREYRALLDRFDALTAHDWRTYPERCRPVADAIDRLVGAPDIDPA